MSGPGAMGRASVTAALVVAFGCADPPSPSCVDLAGDACASLAVPGGTFGMGRGSERCPTCTDGCPAEVESYCEPRETPERAVTLSAFTLDEHEVTVGRFRAFVDAGEGTQMRPPAPGAGAHPSIADSGWDPAWDARLPADHAALRAHLKCVEESHTWTDAPGPNEALPINCVSWYVAMAFCAFDGGRLPTEAEWEYAAAGGDEERVYAWGDDTVEPLPANYFATDNAARIPVGSHRAGDGRWGHADLTGGMWEWALDAYAADRLATTSACDDCALLGEAAERVIRGGNWYSSAGALRVAYRFGRPPEFNRIGIGFRCAGRAP